MGSTAMNYVASMLPDVGHVHEIVRTLCVVYALTIVGTLWAQGLSAGPLRFVIQRTLALSVYTSIASVLLYMLQSLRLYEHCIFLFVEMCIYHLTDPTKEHTIFTSTRRQPDPINKFNLEDLVDGVDDACSSAPNRDITHTLARIAAWWRTVTMFKEESPLSQFSWSIDSIVLSLWVGAVGVMVACLREVLHACHMLRADLASKENNLLLCVALFVINCTFSIVNSIAWVAIVGLGVLFAGALSCASFYPVRVALNYLARSRPVHTAIRWIQSVLLWAAVVVLATLYFSGRAAMKIYKLLYSYARLFYACARLVCACVRLVLRTAAKLAMGLLRGMLIASAAGWGELVECSSSLAARCKGLPARWRAYQPAWQRRQREEPLAPPAAAPPRPSPSAPASPAVPELRQQQQQQQRGKQGKKGRSGLRAAGSSAAPTPRSAAPSPAVAPPSEVSTQSSVAAPSGRSKKNRGRATAPAAAAAAATAPPSLRHDRASSEQPSSPTPPPERTVSSSSSSCGGGKSKQPGSARPTPAIILQPASTIASTPSAAQPPTPSACNQPPAASAPAPADSFLSRFTPGFWSRHAATVSASPSAPSTSGPPAAASSAATVAAAPEAAPAASSSHPPGAVPAGAAGPSSIGGRSAANKQLKQGGASGKKQQQQGAGKQAPTPTAAAAKNGPTSAGAEVDDRMCVVCLEGRREVGLMHGTSLHMCLCKGCAPLFKKGGACPMCRQTIEMIIHEVYGI